MLWNISSFDKVSEKLVFYGWNVASEGDVMLEELKGRHEDELDSSFQQKKRMSLLLQLRNTDREKVRHKRNFRISMRVKRIRKTGGSAM